MRRLPAGLRRGAYDVDISSLIAPLRYDVIVREQFFRLARNMAGASTEEIAAAADGYRIWFEYVEARRRPEIGGEPALIHDAYLDRVDRSVWMLHRFLDDPVRTFEPVVLRVVSDRPTDTGKRIPIMLQPADGCHRLALLRMAGATLLLPDDYRIERGRRPPTDNTARLLSKLVVPVENYLAFVAEGYGVVDVATPEELLEAVRVNVPHRLAELETILDIDLRGRSVPSPV